MVWSGSRPACLPLPFICLPVLFICLPGWVIVVGFPAGLSPTSSAGHVAFLFICLPGLSLLVSSISIHLPGLLLVVFGLERWPCSISIHLSPRSVTGVVRPFPLATQHFYSFVSQVCHCWCPPFPLAMQHFYSFVSQVCHWWCPPFSAGNAAFYSFVSQVCYCWRPAFSAGHVGFLFVCLPGLSLLVSALFRWPCSISIHLSPRSVIGGVRPFALAMQHFYSFVSQVCHC